MKALRNLCLLWIGIILSFTNGFSQSKYTPHILASEQDQALLQKFSKTISTYDPAEIIHELTQRNEDLIKEGYLTSFFTLEFQHDSLLIQWKLGDRYEWSELRFNSEALDLLSARAYQEQDFTSQKFDSKQLFQLSNQLLRKATNQGYPFASVRFVSPIMENGKVSLELNLSLGPQVVYDSITYPKNVQIKDSFLKDYLGLKSGQLYQEDIIKQIPERLSKLPYVQISGEPSIGFANHRSNVYLPLIPRRANRLDGIIGFAPANSLSPKAQITGQLDLELHNLFQSGKYLSLNWQKLRPLSQSLDFKVGYPMVLGSPINMDFEFQLFKEDTSFLRRATNLKFSYWKNARNEISGGVEYKNANILSTIQYENQNRVPPLLDTRSIQWGLGYRYSTLNDFFDPTRGTLVLLNVSAGNRKVRINPRLDTEIYDRIELESPVFGFQANIKQYIPTVKNQHLYLCLQGALMESKQLFQNELYRLGGLKSIRGFSENYFYASRYAVINMEYRIRFDAESYVFAFYDQAYTYFKVPELNHQDFPKAFGAGLNLKVSGGLLSVVYALGASKEQNFGLAYSRIHIGFVGRF